MNHRRASGSKGGDMRQILIIVMVAMALTSAGCGSKKPKPGPSSSTEVGAGADSSGANSDAANAGNVGSDNEIAGPQTGLLAKRVIYFDFDSSEIKGEGNDIVA